MLTEHKSVISFRRPVIAPWSIPDCFVWNVVIGSVYSPTWKFVNPSERFGFLHKLVMKYNLIFRKVSSIEKYNMLKLIAQNMFFVCWITPQNIHNCGGKSKWTPSLMPSTEAKSKVHKYGLKSIKQVSICGLEQWSPNTFQAHGLEIVNESHSFNVWSRAFTSPQFKKLSYKEMIEYYGKCA